MRNLVLQVAMAILLTLPNPVGCRESGGPKPTPTQLPTPAPTATLTPAPTATPVSAGTPWPKVSPTPPPFHYDPSQVFCEVNGSKVTDVGLAVNNCQKGASGPVEVVLHTGVGKALTSAIIESGNILTLLADFKLTASSSSAPILLKPGSTVQGMGWNKSIVEESSAVGNWTVIGVFNASVRNGEKDGPVTIRNLKVQGLTGKEFGSASQAVSMGNCEGCTVEGVWIDATHSIGLQFGGGGFMGHSASNSIAHNLLLTRVASQGLACVNCDGVTFRKFYVLQPGLPGGPGTSSFDAEANGEGDKMRNILVEQFVIDHRSSAFSPTGNGVILNAGETNLALTGNNIVQDGVIIGGDNGYAPEPTNYLSNALYTNRIRGTTFRRIQVSRTGQSCLKLDASADIVVEDVLCEDVGGGGTKGIYASLSGESRLTRVTFRYTGRGPVSNEVEISGSPAVDLIGWSLPTAYGAGRDR